MNEEEAIESGKYLRGELNEKDKEAFEKKMASDQDFALEVALEKEVIQAINNDGVKNLEISLQSIRNEALDIEKKPKSRKFTFNKTYQIAATISLLLFSVFTFYYYSESTKNNQELFTEYYKPYHLKNLRSGNSDYQIALEKYQNQNFSDALKLLTEQLEDSPSKNRTRFLIAHCNIHLDHLDNAIVSFEKVIAQSNNIYIYEANWYLALCYLKKEDHLKTKEILNNIIKAKAKFHQQAAELLEEIEN